MANTLLVALKCINVRSAALLWAHTLGATSSIKALTPHELGDLLNRGDT